MYHAGTKRRLIDRKRPVLVGGGLVLAAVLAMLPNGAANALKAPLRRFIAPAQRGLASVRTAGDQVVLAVQTQFAGARQRARREIERQSLAEENESLKRELHAIRGQLGLLVHSATAADSLLEAECIPARVLGSQALAFLENSRLLDTGKAHGVRTGALIVQPGTIVVDRGIRCGAADGQLLLAGSRVWGKIVAVDERTSTACPIGEPGFRELVRLATPTTDGRGLRYGAKGILEGTGEPLARLRMIDITEPVAEGDLVCSTAGEGFVDVPLICGSVVRAERPEGAGFWEIWVTPAVAERPRDLAILRPAVRDIDVARRSSAPHAETDTK